MSPEKVIKILQRIGIQADDNSYDVRQRIEIYQNRFNDYFRFFLTDGASKICLIFDDAPFVIKWSYDSTRFDEAFDEVLIYKKAVAEGLERFFPKTALLCELNGINFVVQSKIDYSVCEVSPSTYAHYKNITKTAKDSLVRKMETEFKKSAGGYGRDLDTMWGKMALVLYGKRVCQSLCKFVQENSINDLHGYNIGYKDDRPIILDFSGYHREDEY